VEGISHRSHTLDKDGYMIDEGGNDILSCGFVGVFLRTVSSERHGRESGGESDDRGVAALWEMRVSYYNYTQMKERVWISHAKQGFCIV
jgi:hypothetical protein